MTDQIADAASEPVRVTNFEADRTVIQQPAVNRAAAPGFGGVDVTQVVINREVGCVVRIRYSGVYANQLIGGDSESSSPLSATGLIRQAA